MDVAQKLIREHNLTREEFVELIKMADDPQVDALLADEAVRIRKEVYGTDVYTRGLMSLRIIVRMTAIIAESAEAIRMQSGIV